MSRHEKFSFVVPVFDTDPDYLRSCVSSIATAASEYKDGPVELILVDDGSAPRLAAEYGRIMGSDLRFSVRSELVRLPENRGIAFARNCGIRRASGDWMVLVDSDDVVLPSALNRISESVDQDTVLAFTAHEKRSTDLSRTIETRRKGRYAKMLESCAGGLLDPFLRYTFLIHMHVIRKSAYFAVGGFDGSIEFGDEIDFHLRLTDAYRRPSNYSYIDDVLYVYRDNPGGACRDPAKYARLIATIEGIILRKARARGAEVSSCLRSGKEPDGAVAYRCS